MNFLQLEDLMRANESARDGALPTEPYIIARLDGRGFSRLTRAQFNKPYDANFHQLMLETMRYLMDYEPELALAYNQSDEISLLMLPGSSPFNRKSRKLLSLLPAAASAKFSLLLGKPVSFDCRLNIQTEPQGVLHYFRWRSIDAERNAYNACAYWLLRRLGSAPQAAAEQLRAIDSSTHRHLLSTNGIDFDSLPTWQRRGTILHRITETRTGLNPQSGESTTYTRRMTVAEDYSEELLQNIISSTSTHNEQKSQE